MAMPEEPEGADIPEWVVTFGDMMSLLLTFFVLLFSMSEIKQDESVALLESLRKQFGHDSAMVSPMPGRMPPLSSKGQTLASMGRARRLSTMNGGDKVRAPVGDNPRVLSIRPSGDMTKGGTVFFREGSAELGEKEKQTLRQVAELVRGIPQRIEIRGHTSTRPLDKDSPYKSHWELAYARAMAVMKYLVEQGVEPGRIRLEQSADNEPVQVGPDPDKRKQNARVEILILPELAGDVTGAAKQGQKK